VGLVDFLTPHVGATGVPAGDPGALRAAAAKFSASAEAMDSEAAAVRSIAAGVVAGSWFGIAATAFYGAASFAAGDAGTAAQAFRRAAAALEALAAELEAAQELARRAQAAAADLNARSASLDAQAAGADDATLPGLLAQAAGLQLEALAISNQAAAAAEMARAAQARAAAEFQAVAQMAPSVQRRLAAERAAAEAAAEEGDGEPGGLMGVLHDVAKPFRWAGDKGEDVVRGAWNGVAEPVGMVVDLVNPFDSEGGFFGDWANLGSGLWYGVTHPVDFGKALIGVDVWREEGFAYWAGNLIPGAVAAFYTGGASAAVRGTSSTARIANRTEDVLDAAGDVRSIERAIDGAEDLDEAVDTQRIAERAAAEGRTAYVDGLGDELDNFVPGTATLRSGPLDDELVLVQYYEEGGSGTMKWWTSTDEANALTTDAEVMDRLALIPDWGPRDAVRVARIPEGTDVTFLHGRAGPQASRELGVTVPGGGEQFRFLDFDEGWIVASRRLP
jgi:hypothetical protein